MLSGLLALVFGKEGSGEGHRPLSAPGFRRSLLDKVGDFLRMRKHWHVAGGDSDRRSLHYRRFGFLKLRRNSTVLARNHPPRCLVLPPPAPPHCPQTNHRPLPPVL